MNINVLSPCSEAQRGRRSPAIPLRALRKAINDVVGLVSDDWPPTKPDSGAEAAERTVSGDPLRCPRCDRAIRLTTKGAIGRHDQGPFHRITCTASGRNYAAEIASRQPEPDSEDSR